MLVEVLTLKILVSSTKYLIFLSVDMALHLNKHVFLKLLNSRNIKYKVGAFKIQY